MTAFIPEAHTLLMAVVGVDNERPSNKKFVIFQSAVKFLGLTVPSSLPLLNDINLSLSELLFVYPLKLCARCFFNLNL